MLVAMPIGMQVIASGMHRPDQRYGRKIETTGYN